MKVGLAASKRPGRKQRELDVEVGARGLVVIY